jgi:multiple sugar transport system permease protein
MVAIAVVWVWIYQPQYGLLNYAIGLFGIRKQSWLLDSRLVMPSIIGMSIWQGLGYNMIIFLAALQGIPGMYYEAATVDGASRWRMFWRITLPLLSPTTLFVFITTTIRAFQVFTQIYVMTQGGPGHASNVLVLYVYRTAFGFLRMGRASAMAMVLFALIFVLTMLQLKYFKGEVEY